MGIFSKPKKGGAADVIRCDESSYLIWKWHPNGVELGSVKRETAIRTNSILRVKNGEVAVFVYKQNNGNTEDYIVGPFEETIKTKNFPVLSSIIGLWYEGDTPFQAEVFFINVAQAVQIKFGIPYFNVTDPRFIDFEVPVAVRGTLTFGIDDYKAFIKCHQLATFSLDDLKCQIKDMVCRYVKEAVINAPRENGVPVINIESQIGLINEKCEAPIKKMVESTFGVKVNSFDIGAIEVNKDSDGYLELKSVTKDLAKRQAEANTLNYEESLRIEREEGQYAKHLASRQNNLGAYQSEIQGQVGIAGANALGKMGENGVGQINMGNNAGFNPMTMMVGMAVGASIGKNITGTLNESMNPQTPLPPPVPTVKFYLAKNGAAAGPYDLETLRSMIASNGFNSSSLVWKEGMPSWKAAGEVSEFIGFFPPSL